MTQIDKIVEALAANEKSFGLTASMIAKKTRVPRENVRKRIHDLRNEGFLIHTNYRMVNGVRKAYYLMSDAD
jgi:biotin operon repressor